MVGLTCEAKLSFIRSVMQYAGQKYSGQCPEDKVGFDLQGKDFSVCPISIKIKANFGYRNGVKTYIAYDPATGSRVTMDQDKCDEVAELLRTVEEKDSTSVQQPAVLDFERSVDEFQEGFIPSPSKDTQDAVNLNIYDIPRLGYSADITPSSKDEKPTAELDEIFGSQPAPQSSACASYAAGLTRVTLEIGSVHAICLVVENHKNFRHELPELKTLVEIFQRVFNNPCYYIIHTGFTEKTMFEASALGRISQFNHFLNITAVHFFITSFPERRKGRELKTYCAEQVLTVFFLCLLYNSDVAVEMLPPQADESVTRELRASLNEYLSSLEADYRRARAHKDALWNHLQELQQAHQQGPLYADSIYVYENAKVIPLDGPPIPAHFVGLTKSLAKTPDILRIVLRADARFFHVAFEPPLTPGELPGFDWALFNDDGMLVSRQGVTNLFGEGSVAYGRSQKLELTIPTNMAENILVKLRLRGAYGSEVGQNQITSLRQHIAHWRSKRNEFLKDFSSTSFQVVTAQTELDRIAKVIDTAKEDLRLISEADPASMANLGYLSTSNIHLADSIYGLESTIPTSLLPSHQMDTNAIKSELAALYRKHGIIKAVADQTVQFLQSDSGRKRVVVSSLCRIRAELESQFVNITNATTGDVEASKLRSQLKDMIQQDPDLSRKAELAQELWRRAMNEEAQTYPALLKALDEKILKSKSTIRTVSSHIDKWHATSVFHQSSMEAIELTMQDYDKSEHFVGQFTILKQEILREKRGSKPLNPFIKLYESIAYALRCVNQPEEQSHFEK
ncbi:hypothetical protein Dda_0707 [Drechslerella dactyloides]|uniref:Uncharacterized protein n=1 Tax=Drechslerella dactyloides TaxID=74499 RepID=A0AAD6J5C8_DREDA|nr:hypothetical protein Dda_0707 [Drechslerella dactyloides]